MPEQSAGDYAHAVTRAILSAVPYVGGPAAELFAFIFAPPLQGRRKEWFETMADVVRELQEKVASTTPESLSANESFITTAIHASQIAFRNHQQEKIEALRNAVQNSALPNAPGDDVKLMFLDIVDSFTPLQLRIMKLLDDPTGWFEANAIVWPSLFAGGLGIIIERAFPDFQGRRELYNLVGRDLYSRGITDIDGFGGVMSEEGLKARRLTLFGQQFLRFIEKQV